jgi:hypothetical protein
MVINTSNGANTTLVEANAVGCFASKTASYAKAREKQQEKQQKRIQKKITLIFKENIKEYHWNGNNDLKQSCLNIFDSKIVKFIKHLYTIVLFKR